MCSRHVGNAALDVFQRRQHCAHVSFTGRKSRWHLVVFLAEARHVAGKPDHVYVLANTQAMSCDGGQ